MQDRGCAGVGELGPDPAGAAEGSWHNHICVLERFSNRSCGECTGEGKREIGRSVNSYATFQERMNKTNTLFR